MEGQRVRYGAPSVWMNGVRLPVPSESECICSLGRHTLPHVYHREDFRKLMTATRRAFVVVPLKSLRAQYPLAMYDPKAGGMARIQAGVRPPPPSMGVAFGGPPRRIRPARCRRGESAGAPPARACGGGALGHTAPRARHADHVFIAQLRPPIEPPQPPHPRLRQVGANVCPLAV